MAEIIDIQFALNNYDWHYNLMDIQGKLEEVQLFNYANHIAEKLDYTDKIKEKTSDRLTVVKKGLDAARSKKLELIQT